MRRSLRNLSRCQNQPAETFNKSSQRCAIALTAELVQKGYMNSRVVVDTSRTPARLELIEGRLVELQITTSDAHLRQKAKGID